MRVSIELEGSGVNAWRDEHGASVEMTERHGRATFGRIAIESIQPSDWPVLTLVPLQDDIFTAALASGSKADIIAHAVAILEEDAPGLLDAAQHMRIAIEGGNA